MLKLSGNGNECKPLPVTAASATARAASNCARNDEVFTGTGGWPPVVQGRTRLPDCQLMGTVVLPTASRLSVHVYRGATHSLHHPPRPFTSSRPSAHVYCRSM